MTLADAFVYGFVLLFAIAIASIILLARRSERLDQERLDAEYAEEWQLYDRASRWPTDGCRWCGSTDTPLDHIHRCTYCAELQRLTGPVRDPSMAPFRMCLIR